MLLRSRHLTLLVTVFYCILAFASSVTASQHSSSSQLSASITSPPSSTQPSGIDVLTLSVPTPAFLQINGHTYALVDVTASSSDPDILSVGTRQWYITVILAVCCVTLAALAAGLTVGLVSIDPLDLAIILSMEEEDCSSEEEVTELRQEKMWANRLMPLVQKHHLLLVTLLVMNSFANELLPLLLDDLVPSWVAVVLSVSFVLLFGEILPSSIFTGKSQLRLAASLTPLVWFFLVVLYPLAAPIAWVLDNTLGIEEDSRMRRSELKSLIRLHANQPSLEINTSPSPEVPHEDFTGSPRDGNEAAQLSVDEMTILHGVLELKDKTIRDCMVPLEDCYMLSTDDVLDLGKLAEILHEGHSRVPIYDGERRNIRGVLLVKRLIVINPEDKRKMRTIGTRWPTVIAPDTPLLGVLNAFQAGSHQAVVCDNPKMMIDALRAEKPIPPECEVLGIITIEDVFEMLIKEEIHNETDVSVSAHLKQKAVVRNRLEKLKMLTAREKAIMMKAKSGSHTRAGSIAIVSSRSSKSLSTTLTTTLSSSASPKITAAATSESPLLKGLRHHEASPLIGSISPPTAYRSVEETFAVTVDVTATVASPALSSTSSSASSAAAAASASPPLFALIPSITVNPDSHPLPRDEKYSTRARAAMPTPSNAATQTPTTTSSSSTATPTPSNTVSASRLQPRAAFSSGAMTRKDLDAGSVQAIREIRSSEHHQSSTSPQRSVSNAGQQRSTTDEEKQLLLPPPASSQSK